MIAQLLIPLLHIFSESLRQPTPLATSQLQLAVKVRKYQDRSMKQPIDRFSKRALTARASIEIDRLVRQSRKRVCYRGIILDKLPVI